MKTKSIKTDYRFEIGQQDITITHESETDHNFPSVDVPELSLIANQLDQYILALLEVRRDMKLRGFETGKPGRTTPAVSMVGKVVMR